MEGGKVLQRLLDLPMPAVGVANEPATVHSEYLLLSDIHIASERATYGDSPHPAFGITGGDGLHVVWEEIAGTARAKRLLWTGEQIDARTALAWGVVSEVVPHERAVDRGIQIARGLAGQAGALPDAAEADTQSQLAPPDHPGCTLRDGARRPDRGRLGLPEQHVADAAGFHRRARSGDAPRAARRTSRRG